MIRDIRIGFTAGAGPIGWAIRRLDQAQLEDGAAPSKINHVLLRVICLDGFDFIFQSHGKGGVGICFTSDLKRAVGDGKVFRYAEKSLGLNLQSNQLAVARMQTFSGAAYDRFMIACYYAAFRFGWNKAPALGNDARYTCNEAVLKVLAGLVSWANAEDRKTPEALFAAAFQCPSPSYFGEHPDIPTDFW